MVQSSRARSSLAQVAAAFASLAALEAPSALSGQGSPELLPDIVVPASFLNDHDFRTVGGRLLLRLTNGTANVGDGPLYLYGVTPGNGDGTQDVRQRVYREDGSFFERLAGRFVYHPDHNHIHFENWCQYRLRQRIGTDGVGDIVAEGAKTSFCILDLQVYNRSLPNFDPDGRFRSCSTTIQGLSVGWVDVYDRTLAGQSIDITGVPDGFYWLESEVDPDDGVLEESESNNVTRIPITLGNPSTVNPDAYEVNNTTTAVRAMAVGRPNSSNLGPCNPKFDAEDLTIHNSTDVDLFRFYSNHTGASTDFVRVDFINSAGNIDLELLDDAGNVIASSATSGDFERVSLEGRPEGWYFARIVGRTGATSPNYKLTINPPANEPPAIETLRPPAGNTVVRHGLDLYRVEWAASDPEADEMWVSVYFNTLPVLDDNAFLVPTTLHSPADLGFVTINTAEAPEGRYWVYCQVSDGGTSTGDWSSGTLEITELDPECVDIDGTRDCNSNGIVDACDLSFGSSQDCNSNSLPDECDIASGTSTDADGDDVPDECQLPRFHRADANDDGRHDVSDAVAIVSFLFRGGVVLGCLEAADTNNDHEIDVTDVIFGLNYLFRGGPAPPEPGPPGSACGTDPGGLDPAAFLGCEEYLNC
jgi:hypothetical protein